MQVMFLSVWDGKTPGGAGTTLLAKWSVNSKAPQTVVATSGSMYLLFESDGSGVDSGYAGSYTSELGPATLPTPAFTPNTTPSYKCYSNIIYKYHSKYSRCSNLGMD